MRSSDIIKPPPIKIAGPSLRNTNVSLTHNDEINFPTASLLHTPVDEVTATNASAVASGVLTPMDNFMIQRLGDNLLDSELLISQYLYTCIRGSTGCKNTDEQDPLTISNAGNASNDNLNKQSTNTSTVLCTLDDQNTKLGTTPLNYNQNNSHVKNQNSTHSHGQHGSGVFSSMMTSTQMKNQVVPPQTQTVPLFSTGSSSTVGLDFSGYHYPPIAPQLRIESFFESLQSTFSPVMTTSHSAPTNALTPQFNNPSNYSATTHLPAGTSTTASSVMAKNEASQLVKSSATDGHHLFVGGESGSGDNTMSKSAAIGKSSITDKSKNNSNTSVMKKKPPTNLMTNFLQSDMSVTQNFRPHLNQQQHHAPNNNKNNNETLSFTSNPQNTYPSRVISNSSGNNNNNNTLSNIAKIGYHSPISSSSTAAIAIGSTIGNFGENSLFLESLKHYTPDPSASNSSAYPPEPAFDFISAALPLTESNHFQNQINHIHYQQQQQHHPHQKHGSNRSFTDTSIPMNHFIPPLRPTMFQQNHILNPPMNEMNSPFCAEMSHSTANNTILPPSRSMTPQLTSSLPQSPIDAFSTVSPAMLYSSSSSINGNQFNNIQEGLHLTLGFGNSAMFPQAHLEHGIPYSNNHHYVSQSEYGGNQTNQEKDKTNDTEITSQDSQANSTSAKEKAKRPGTRGRPRKNKVIVEKEKLEPHPPKPKKRFICTVDNCGKVFPRLYNLKSHLLCHSGDRPHACPYCVSTFGRKHDLQRHVRTLHAEMTLYECPRCKQGFPRLDSFQHHLAVEEGGLIIPDHLLHPKVHLPPVSKPKKSPTPPKVTFTEVKITSQ